MTTWVTHRHAIAGSVLVLVVLSVSIAVCQPLSNVGAPPPILVLAARVDPADPLRYTGVFADELSETVGIYRGGQQVRTTVPFFLEPGDEIETRAGVIAVLSYPVGDVYINQATRLRIGSLDVLFGKIFARVRGVFSVESQDLVAGVEGTEFAFEVGRESAHVTVLDGGVLCSSRNLPWKPIRITRGNAFALTDAGHQLRVGPASPAELAQLQTWVRSVDDSVLRLASPQPGTPSVQQPSPAPVSPPAPVPPTPFQPAPTPAPPPIYQPVPVPIPIPIPAPQPVPPPPVPALQWGYCCEAGRVVSTTVEGCRGPLYRSEREAYARCKVVPSGYCCANGRIYPSGAENCPGTFAADQARAQAACTTPPPTPGYCCAGGQITRASQNQCRGSFFVDEANARKNCALPPQAGYCCSNGAVVQANRDQCRGRFFADLATARRVCAPPPEQGYCCVHGQVSLSTRDRCSGTFARSPEEAQRACRPAAQVPIEKGVIKPPQPAEPK